MWWQSAVNIGIRLMEENCFSSQPTPFYFKSWILFRQTVDCYFELQIVMPPKRCQPSTNPTAILDECLSDGWEETTNPRSEWSLNGTVLNSVEAHIVLVVHINIYVLSVMHLVPQNFVVLVLQANLLEPHNQSPLLPTPVKIYRLQFFLSGYNDECYNQIDKYPHSSRI